MGLGGLGKARDSAFGGGAYKSGGGAPKASAPTLTTSPYTGIPQGPDDKERTTFSNEASKNIRLPSSYYEQLRAWYRQFQDNIEDNPLYQIENNLAMTPTAYNVSGVSPEETQRRERVRDYWDNRLRLTNARAGSMITTEGGGSSGSDSVMHELSRYPQMNETIDSRQQQRNEGYEGTAQGARISRQQAALNMDLQMQQEYLREERRRSGAAWDEGMRRQADTWNMYTHYYLLTHDEPYRRAYHIFMTQLERLDLVAAQTNMISEVYAQDPDFASNIVAYLAGIPAGVPNLLHRQLQSTVTGIIQQYGPEVGFERTIEMALERTAKLYNIGVDQLKEILKGQSN